MSAYEHDRPHDDPPGRRPARTPWPLRDPRAHDEDGRRRRGARGVPRRPRGGDRGRLPGRRPERARPPVAGRAPDRRSGGRPASGERALTILLDSSAVIAAADRADLNHAAAVAWFGRADEPLLLGALNLAELDALLQRELGPSATQAVLQSLEDGTVRLVAPTEVDLRRAAELLAEAAEHRPRLVDAVLVATAERLGVRRVATFDRRPIAIFRPRHVRALDLEP